MSGVDERREFGRWWMWALALLVVSVVIFTGLHYLGVIGKTHVERQVFEASYQYSEARKAEIATYEAQLSELEMQLAEAPDATADQINSQMAAIRIRLAVAKERK